MSNLKDIKGKVKRNVVLTDDEYNELVKQKEIEERPERARQRQRNYEDGQFMKFGFIAGLIVGAMCLYALLTLLGALK